MQERPKPRNYASSALYRVHRKRNAPHGPRHAHIAHGSQQHTEGSSNGSQRFTLRKTPAYREPFYWSCAWSLHDCFTHMVCYVAEIYPHPKTGRRYTLRRTPFMVLCSSHRLRPKVRTLCFGRWMALGGAMWQWLVCW